MQQQHKPHLLRGLNARHIRFIALGSAIGTGLFYGSASAIKAAGPAVLLAYLIGGAAVFIVMRALGEMAVRNPVSGSFGSYARQYLGPLAGFITGWTLHSLRNGDRRPGRRHRLRHLYGIVVPRCAALDLDPQHHLLYRRDEPVQRAGIWRDGVLAVSGEGGGDYRHDAGGAGIFFGFTASRPPGWKTSGATAALPLTAGRALSPR